MRRLWLVLTAAFALLAGSTVVLVPTASANTLVTNPFGIAYGSVNGVAQYGHPSGMLITGRCNRYDQEFADARANGAEVLAYLDAPERPDSRVCGLDSEFYMGDPSQVPLWPGERVNYPNTHLTDIRVGSAWTNFVVAYIENLMRDDLMHEDKVDGVFLDVIGARLWGSLANWDSWPQQERDDWTNGAVDLVRRLDASRRAINPRFIIVNNSVWDTPGGAGLRGEEYVDGICLEHSPLSDYHKRVAGKPYGNLGHRRVLAIAPSDISAQDWANVQGVTHVSDQQAYSQPSNPPIVFHRLTDRPKTFGRTTIGTTPSSGMSADQKRGSKFTLPDKATLLGLSAYLDGQGGPSTGSQSVRMVLYNDSNGLPAGRVAQSNDGTIAAATTGRWVTFTTPATPLDPGQYWIVLQTGATQGIARNRGGDSPDNWYGLNNDPFTDGPSNPFGTGAAGTGTLSVNATYTVG
jgi:hypothetical protein